MWLDDVWSCWLTSLFGLGLNLWSVKTTVCLYTLNELSVFTSKVNKHFISEGIELYTSFSLLRRPNVNPLTCGHDELKDSLLNLILVKTNGLCYVPRFNLWKIKDFGVLSFPTLLNTKKHYCEVKHYNIPDTKDFGSFLHLPLYFQ